MQYRNTSPTDCRTQSYLTGNKSLKNTAFAQSADNRLTATLRLTPPNQLSRLNQSTSLIRVCFSKIPAQHLF